MVSEIFPVVASDQHAEKNSSPNTLHVSPSPTIISEQQLPVSSSIVKYTLFAGRIELKKKNRKKKEKEKKKCKTTKCNDVIRIP